MVAVAGAGWPVEAAKVAPEETAEDDLDFFFFLAVCCFERKDYMLARHVSRALGLPCNGTATYLMPRPDGLETVEERDVLPEVREQPEAGRGDKVGDAEKDDAEGEDEGR